MQQHPHVREFNEAFYRASAPIACRLPGLVPKILHRDDSGYLYGIIERPNTAARPTPQEWAPNGSAYSEECSGPHDLVMLPLFYIDDQPVFTGDEIMNDGGHIVKASPALDNVARMWKFPPAIATKMTREELVIAFNAGAKVKLSGWSLGEANHLPEMLEVLANTTLRRAVADGQLIHASHFWSTACGTVYGSQAAIKGIEQRFIHAVTPEKHAEAVAALKNAGFRYSELHGWEVTPEHKHRSRDTYAELGFGTVYGERQVLDEMQRRLHAFQGIDPVKHAAIVREAIGMGYNVAPFTLTAELKDEIMTRATKEAGK